MSKIRLPYKTGTVRVSSPFGSRWLNGERDQHNGIDLVGTDKTLCSPVDGVVAVSTILDKATDKTLTWQWGNYVRIDGDDGNHYYLCHMEKRLVSAGVRVKAGDGVGVEGNTGYSFGNHCHFEVRNAGWKSVNPAELLGIRNAVGEKAKVDDTVDYAALVCKKCGLEAKTRAYIDKYKYAGDLWRKLWLAMGGERE